MQRRKFLSSLALIGGSAALGIHCNRSPNENTGSNREESQVAAGAGSITEPVNERPLWQIPYRSLLPRKTKNLLVAGRCFSFEKALVEDTRIIGTCLVTGHGAGAASVVAVNSGCGVNEVDIKEVQKILTGQNAMIA